ncbi:MAG: helix-turn-helix domain-containing protein [Usitatibacteraceae bacterium]
MKTNRIQKSDIDPASRQVACGNCAMGKLCFPHALPPEFQSLFPLVEEQRIRLDRDEFLFSGEKAVGVYAIKAGFLKSAMPLADGQSKIVGFHAMGDALGLDALGHGVHTTDAIALKGSEVCLIPLEKFEKLLEHPTESFHVRQLLSREMARVEAHAAAIGVHSARQRVAAFLLDMSERWQDRGYSKNEFVLYMGRKEIGNYLGLTFETVSRTLSQFQAEDCIVVHGKNVTIKDMAALKLALSTQ